jgi:urea transporter
MKVSKLFWIPRVLVIIFILFLSLFSLDVFGTEASFIEEIVGFLIHSIPSIALAIVLAATWRRPMAGGVLFVILSLVMGLCFRTYRSVLNFSALTLPLIIAGALFIIFHYKTRMRPQEEN